jgi:hypothetical protein
MRTLSIKPGDIVACNKKGRLFHAKVIGAGAAGTLLVQPIERNISYRHITPVRSPTEVCLTQRHRSRS